MEMSPKQSPLAQRGGNDMASDIPDIDKVRYQALKAEVERLGYKVEDVPRLMAEMAQAMKKSPLIKAG